MEEKGKRQRSQEERLMFLKVAEERGITEACQRFGIPRTTYYSWKTKLEQGGEEALQGRSGGANRGKREIEEWKRKEVLAEREKRLRIRSFMKLLNKVNREDVSFFGCGKSRRVITEILVANGLSMMRDLSKRKYPNYRPRLSRYCPNAQLVIDGKELAIEFMEERFSFNLEMAKDMVSDVITGHSVTEEEDAQVVWEVLEQHTRRYGAPLALLLDNDCGRR